MRQPILASLVIGYLLAVHIVVPDIRNQQTDVLIDLLHGPLAKDNILLGYDSSTLKSLAMDQVLHNSSKGMPSSVMVLKWDDPENLLLRAPIKFLRGSLLTVVLIFSTSPLHFLDALDAHWNPDFLVLVSLNENLNSTKLLEHNAVQRSQHLTLIEYRLHAGNSSFWVFTSKPFQPTRKGRALKYPLGAWNAKEYASKVHLFPKRLDLFHGSVFHLASWCDDFPFMYYVDDSEMCIGLNLEILSIFANKLNFTYTIQSSPPDFKWGDIENSTWTGMLGDLNYRGKDLVINSFLLRHEFIAEFDFTIPYIMEGQIFLLRIPPPLPQWQGLLYPFTWVTWTVVICTTAAVAILLTFYLSKMPDSQNVSSVPFMIFAGILRQSVPWQNEIVGPQVLIGLWWLMGNILTCAYTCNLIAFLTIPVYPERIETVQQLADSGLRVVMQDIGIPVPDLLKASSDPSFRSIGHKFDLLPYAYNSINLGFDMANEGTHAFVDYYPYMMRQRQILNHTSSTYAMREKINNGYNTWYLKKNTLYTQIFRDYQTRMVEAGLVTYLYNQHMEKATGDQAIANEKVSSAQPLKMAQLLGAFILWSLGNGMATLSFLMEILANRLRHKP